MNRIKYFLRVYMVSCIIAAVAALIFLVEARHSADQIAATVATPLILLQLMPYLLSKIPHEHLPTAPQDDPLQRLSPRGRRLMRVVVGMFVIFALATAIGLAIVASLPVYYLLHLGWAVKGGAKIGATLIAIGGIIPGSFIAGAYLASRLKNVNIVEVLSGTASRGGDRIRRIQHA